MTGMDSWLYHLTNLAIVAVFVFLCLGLWNLLTTRSDANRSQMLMRWRVGLQFVAIVLIMLFVYARYGWA
jgi:hypothetical protein